MKITRRTMLISGGLVGGGLLLGLVGVGTFVKTFDQRDAQSGALSDRNTKMLTQWITIGPDGHVTLLSSQTEMGQGAQTGLLQILLDELDLDPARTSVEQAPAAKEFATGEIFAGFMLGDEELGAWAQSFANKAFGRLASIANAQITGGSSSIRFMGWRGIRHAAAAGRQMLAEAGAAHLGVPVAEVSTENSKVMHAKSGESVDYGEIASAAAALDVPQEPKFKTPEQWKYIGKPHPRIDIPDKVFAKAVYGIDVVVPNMRYAAVAPAPLALGTITGVSNKAEIEKRRGVEAVLRFDDVVAVVADNPWRAEQAARAAKIECSPPDGAPLDSAQIAESQRTALAAGKAEGVFERGDAKDALSSGDIIERELVVPFLAHSPMEPLNATIWSEGDKVHVATGVQSPLSARAIIAETLGRDLEDVVLHPHTMGGGFGRRTSSLEGGANWIIHAAKIHKAVGGAVKMTWSREADVRLSNLRPADTAKLRAKLGDDGKPVAWHALTYAKIMAPPEATPVYDIPNVLVETTANDPALPYAYWRSVDASTHGFFVECFIDELARAAEQDPIEYRKSLLSKHPRHVRLLERVAQMSQWPKGPGIVPNSALGVAVFESFGSIVAEVAEVSIVDGKPRVHHVWCAVDCGIAVNPDSVEAQMQGGIIFGLTAALYGEITVKNGQITQSNFHDYPMVRFADGPRIDVEILNTPDVPVGGAGEPSTPPIGPAVANAIATLKDRPKGMPFSTMA